MNQDLKTADLLSLLNLTRPDGSVDEDIVLSFDGENEKEKFISIQRLNHTMYCPVCDNVMHSKGFYERKVKHPIMQDGKVITISLKQRKYRCTNRECNYYANEEFGFVDKFKKTTTMLPYLILRDMKDVSLTCASVSRRYQISDTYVHSTMMKYLDFERLPLSEVISIDEVFLDIDYEKRYCLIIRDFISGDIIEVLKNRNDDTIRRFFLSIPLEERKKVKFVVSDMYDPYLHLPMRFLPCARSAVDSFHIAQHITMTIRQYMNTVKKKYQKKLDEERMDNNYRSNRSYKTRKDSPELYLLKKHYWVLLGKSGNEPDISSKHLDRTLGIYPTVEKITKLFLKLDPHFPVLKRLRDSYLDFNDSYLGNPDEAQTELEKLIESYETCEESIFKEFAMMLEKHKEEIVLSFTLIKRKNSKGEEFLQRLSNGPMESFNRKPKDLKRNGRGYKNFEFIRNRILWSSRKDAAILAIPKDDSQIYRSKGKKRGHYKKK